MSPVLKIISIAVDKSPLHPEIIIIIIIIVLFFVIIIITIITN